MSAYADRLPTSRPSGLRLTTRRNLWYRLGSATPASWGWKPFPAPGYRFDSAAGKFRVRYAADAERAAMREGFDAEGRIVSPDHLRLRLIQLTGTIRVLDLRQERNLDALGLDDQINTSRAPGVWTACQQLADLVFDWYGQQCHGLVYRSRTTPQHSANLAFLAHAPLTATSLGPLGRQHRLLAACQLSDGLTVLT